MGMMIDEAIKHIEYLEKFSYVKQDRESFITAIDTMCKYQKIQEIFDRYDKGELTHDMFGLFVGEVLEDGDDDTM